VRDGGRADGVVVLRRRLMVIEQRRRRRRRRRWLLLRLVRGRLRGRRRVWRRRRTAATTTTATPTTASATTTSTHCGHRCGYAAVMVVMVVVAGRGLLAGLVVQDGHAHQPLGRVGHVGRLDLGRHLTLPFVPPILEPYLHLGLGQVQGRGKPGPFRAGQVPLDVERRLELEHLAPGEHRAGLLLPLAARPAAPTAVSSSAPAPSVVLFTGVVVVRTVVCHVVVVVHGHGRVHRLIHVTAAASAVAHEPSLVVRRPGASATTTVLAGRPSIRTVAGQRRRAARVDAHAVWSAGSAVLFVCRARTP